MKFCLRIVLLLFLVTGTLTQDGFDLLDALGDPDPTPAKPKEQPKAPEKPKTEGDLDLLDAFGPDKPEPEKPEPEKPKKPTSGGGGGGGLDLEDALGPDKPEPEKPKKPTSGGGGGGLDLEDAVGPDKPEPEKPKKPTSGGGGGGGFDLEDALGPDLNPKPDKPAVVPPKSGGGGGAIDDSDLLDVAGGDYKPEGGRSGGGRAEDPVPDDAADQPQEAAGGPIAGVVSAIGVAILGAASSYFAYQKKKLCFKLQGGEDPESGKDQHGTQSEPQVLSNLLKTS